VGFALKGGVMLFLKSHKDSSKNKFTYRFSNKLYWYEIVLVRGLRGLLNFTNFICSGRISQSYGIKSIGNLRTSTKSHINTKTFKYLYMNYI